MEKSSPGLVSLPLHRKILYGLVLILLCLAAVELFLRVTNIKYRRESPFFLLVQVHEYPEYFRRHPSLFWELIPGRTIRGEYFPGGEYDINSQGLRGPEFPVAKPAGTVRICCIGNSCTFGWKIPEGETYASLLTGELQKLYPDRHFEVINCGVPGYTSLQGLRLLKGKILNYQPDIISLSFGWNEIWAAGRGIADKDQAILPTWISWLQNHLDHLRTYALIKYWVFLITEPRGGSKIDPANPVYRISQTDYRDNLAAIHDLAVANRITPIFLTSPTPDPEVYLGPNKHTQLDEVFRIHDSYNEVLERLANEQGYLVVPLATYFQNRTGLYDSALQDYIHYNPAGHAEVARLLARYIKRFGAIRP